MWPPIHPMSDMDGAFITVRGSTWGPHGVVWHSVMGSGLIGGVGCVATNTTKLLALDPGDHQKQGKLLALRRMSAPLF